MTEEQEISKEIITEPLPEIIVKAHPYALDQVRVRIQLIQPLYGCIKFYCNQVQRITGLLPEIIVKGTQ